MLGFFFGGCAFFGVCVLVCVCQCGFSFANDNAYMCERVLYSCISCLMT
jgi:hypothetical protein